MSKVSDYYDLVVERKRCQKCDQSCIHNPALYEDGKYDSDEIGPWTRWQGNLDAKVMVVGQDWGDTNYLKNNNGLERRANPTNETLRDLLASIGITIDDPGDLRRSGVVFFTNAILCMKEGSLQAPTQPSWFANCRPFLKRQIEIVSPELLICLGEWAYRSVAAVFEFKPKKFREAVESDGHLLENNMRVVARYHCGQRVLNIVRDKTEQLADWDRLKKFL